MLIALPVLLSCSAFFSGGETALFSLSRHQRLQMSRAKSIAASAITRLLDEKRALLVTVLLGNMFVNVLYFVMGTVLLIGLHDREVLGATAGNIFNIAALLLLILIGEVLPKLVASQYALRWSVFAAVPLLLIHRVLSPLRITFLAVIVEPMSRLLAPKHQPAELSAEELETLLELSQHHGVIDDREEKLLQQVMSLGQMKVADLMTPRVDIKAFNLADDPKQLIEIAARTRVSRLPVFHNDLDQVAGIVYTRQVLQTKPRNLSEVEPLIREVKFVPELQRADRVLVDLRKSSTSLAIAVDEYGGTAGLVTLEDAVEQMVGQIADHHEVVPEVQSIGPDRWRVSAGLGIHEWIVVFGPIAPIASVSTVGGLVMARIGRVPKVGDLTTVGNVSIEVEKMDGLRIESLLLQLVHPKAENGARQ